MSLWLLNKSIIQNMFITRKCTKKDMIMYNKTAYVSEKAWKFKGMFYNLTINILPKTHCTILHRYAKKLLKWIITGKKEKKQKTNMNHDALGVHLIWPANVGVQGRSQSVFNWPTSITTAKKNCLAHWSVLLNALNAAVWKQLIIWM